MFFGPLHVIGSLAEGVGDVKFVTLVEYYQYFFFTLWCSCHMIGVVMSDSNHVH